MHQAQVKIKSRGRIIAVESFADPYTLENSYLARTGPGRALVIDPNPSQLLLRRVAEIGAGQVTVALTHAHADHICGIAPLMERCSIRIICSRSCAPRLMAPSKTGLEFLLAMLRMQDMRDGGHRGDGFMREYRPCRARAMITFDNGLSLNDGSHALRFIPAPGHSPGSCVIVLDGACAFTGDSLFRDCAAVTRFPRGSTSSYRAIAVPALKSLPPCMQAFPGHGAPFLMRDGVFSS